MPPKKTTPPPRYYWDACVFLSYINGDQERCKQIRPMLQEARKEQLRIITSVLSITEVAFATAEQDNKILDPSVEAKIDALWTPPTIVVEHHRLIAVKARDLMRQSLLEGKLYEQWKLTPLDAIHLATAMRMGVDEFHTYDEKLKRYGDLTGLTIKEPETSQEFLPGMESET